MNPDYRDIELIDRYLTGALSSDEKFTFEKRIRQDADFANELKVQKISGSLLEDYELLKVKDQMQKDLSVSKPFSFSRNWLIGLFIAAGSVGLFFVFNKKNNSDSKEKTVSQSEILSKNPLILSDTNQISSNKKFDQKKDLSLKKSENNNTITGDSLNNIIHNSNPVLIDINPDSVSINNNKVDKDKVSITEDPCTNLKIEYSLNKENTCENQSTGSIIITGLKGGKRPYIYKISSEENFVRSGRFNNLGSGEYTFSIKEGNGCVYNISEPVIISSKKCNQTFNQTFTPSQDDTWKFPVSASQSGQLKIINKTGITEYEVSFSNGYPGEWNGINNKGEETSAGYYIVIIELSDGNTINGYLTINR